MSGGGVQSGTVNWNPYLYEVYGAGGGINTVRLRCQHCGYESMFLAEGSQDYKCKSCGSRKWEAAK